MLVEPDRDVLPIRSPYAPGSEWQISLNHLESSSQALWYTLADLTGSRILSRRPARVIEAIRLVPIGKQSSLTPVGLRGSVTVDPANDDFFQRVIELRKTSASGEKRLDQFLKTLANSASYGVFAEMNRSDKLKPGTVMKRFGLDSQSVEVNLPEEPGRWCFPPLAAFIAGGARLMLAMLEKRVADAGGIYAFCDTDSLAIVASNEGGLVECPGGPYRLNGRPAIRVLPRAVVNRIVQEFDQLNPYNRESVGDSLLKVERENFDGGEFRQLYTYVISAKRYCLFNLDEEVDRSCGKYPRADWGIYWTQKTPT